MSYNKAVIISLIICAIISFLLSYFLSLLFFGEDSGLFKISQLILAIVSMTTLYSPIKFKILKYMHVEGLENEDENI